MMGRRIFISCVTSEFKTLRTRLRSYLTSADCEVKTQEDFRQEGVDIIEKLDDYIKKCDAVIHIIGHEPGSVADEKPRREFLEQNDGFLAKKPELLAKLGDFSDLTYTQWEAFLAIHHGVEIRAYHYDGAQPEHRDRLKLGLAQRYTSPIEDEMDVLGKLIGDLRDLLPELPVVRVSNLPASIGTLFKGRDDTLIKLRESLSQSQHATAITAPKAIHGLGGIGKTRLAIEYGRRFADDYTALLLVRADSPENFRRNLAELTGPLVLNLPEYTEPDESARLAAALRWLDAHPGWYLIIDNVDTEPAMAEVEAQLDRLNAGHVVITSRLGDWPGGVETLDLSVLDEADAIDFLNERTGARRPKAETDAADVVTLAGKLDGLALALEQAGAYIAERRVSYHKYLEHWETRRRKVLEWHNEAKMRYPASIAITWQTSFDEISDDARKLLEILAELAPDPIPRGIIEEGGDTGDLEDAFIELDQFSLVRLLEEPPETFSVHRLVQEIVREFPVSSNAEGEPPLPTPPWLTAAWLLAIWAPSGGQDISTWDQWTLLEPHLERIFEKSADHDDPGSDPAPVPHLLVGFGGFQKCRNGFYAEAERCFRRAVSACNRDLEPDDNWTLTSEMWLGSLLGARGAYEEAEPLYRRALEARERVLGVEHPETLKCENNLAALLESQGAYEEAEPLYRRVLEARERVLGAEHPDTLISVNNLAALLNARGAHEEAEPLYRRSLEGSERFLGAEHPDTLISVNNLAEMLRAKGAYEEAEPLFRRALEARERFLGAEHPDTLMSVNNLGGLLRARGANEKAEPLFRRALEARERVLGAEHPDTLMSVNNLAALLRALGANEEAEPLYRRALEARERVLGAEHPSTLISVNNLAFLLRAKGAYDEAEPLYQRAYEGFLAKLGPEHPDTKMVKRNWNRCRAEMEKGEE